MINKKIKFLLTGGAGYMGTQMSHLLNDLGHQVSIIDDLSNGTQKYLPKNIKFYKGNYGNKNLVKKVINENKPDLVIHLAGNIIQYESYEKPLLYYENNLINAFNFFRTCIECKIKNFVISSTAAIYGNTKNKTIREIDLNNPYSPYSRTKLSIEWLLEDLSNSEKINYIFLRYFNVAGADMQIRCGQLGKKSTHIVKIIVEYIQKKRNEISIFGNNFQTYDGTCIRDFIHVHDLVDAHLKASIYLLKNKKNEVFNLGSGRGYSVIEVIKKAEDIFNKKIKIKFTNRRNGDSARLVANISKAKKQLIWYPKYSDIENILKTACLWEEKIKNSRDKE